MALIGEKNFTISQINGNGYGSVNNKFNYYSQTSLLSTRVEFKSEKEHSPDDSSDEETNDNLKTKYIHLKPDPTNEPKQGNANGGTLQAILGAKSTNNNDLLRKPNSSKEGNELGQPKHMLYSREQINVLLDWKKMNKIGAGLSNLGNTCFLNSVLQCLTYCPPLVNYLNITKEEHMAKCRQNFCMICLLTNHVNNALLRVAPVIKPIQICQRIKSIAKHFNFGRQEDSHEFLRYVIDHLWRSCLAIHEQELGITGTAAKLDHLTKSTTAINHIFGGYHRSQVSCLNCKEKSNTYDYFMDFMLEIQNVSSLQEALQKFVTPETLSHENAYKCSKCKKSVSAKKQFTVYRAPNVATFQFKRFDCTRVFGKISKFISYSEKLNLAPYMSDKSAPIMYKLASVLVHHGQTSNSGHYFCYVRNSNNSWYVMDDSHVSQVSLDEVLKQKAYVLFYVRTPDANSQQHFQGHNKLAPKLNVNAQTLLAKQESFQNNSPIQKQVFSSNFMFSNGPSDKASVSGGYLNGSLNSSNTAIKSTPLSATSLRLNLTSVANKSLHQQSASSPKKPAVLVPYDSDDEKQPDDDVVSSNNADKKTVPLKRDQKSQSQDSRPSSSNSSTVSGDLTLPPSRPSSSASSSTHTQVRSEPVKEPIPILKVKATTNSWQVVEAKPTSSSKGSSDDKNLKVQQSNWKISRSSYFSNNNQFSEKSTTLNGNSHEKYRDDKYNSNCHKEHSDADKLDRALKDKKKKHKKKDKERQKRRDDDSDDDDTELKWVERTKETLEMESKSQHKSNDYSEKRKFSQVEQESSSTSVDGTKKMKHTSVENSRKTDVLDSLLKGALPKGFDENVKSWNGESSNLNRSIAEDNRKSAVYDYDEDEYNNEFDQGKIKKTKKPMEKVDLFTRNSVKMNPFQRAGNNRYAHNNSSNSLPNENQAWFRNNFNKPPANKFNGLSNRPFVKFGEGGGGGGASHHKDRHFGKHKDNFSSFGNKNGHPYNSHHRPNSNGGYHQKKFFKHR